jgi:hypothetical protein
MKAVFTFLAVAVLLAITPNPCFAAWDVEIVTKERARELGMELRPTAAGPSTSGWSSRSRPRAR